MSISGKSLFLGVILFAVPLEAVADANRAYAALQQGRPAEALRELAAVEQSLGRLTPRTESLKIYAYVALKDWKNARIALTRYQQLAGAGAASEAHQALLKLEPEIDRGLAEADAKWRQEKQQAEAALLKSLADADAGDHRAREKALHREAEKVARLEADAKAGPREEVPPPELMPEEITDEQVASLASDPAELAGWLEVNAGNAAAAPLVARLKQTLVSSTHQTPVTLGDRILVGLTRETGAHIFTSFPADTLSTFADKPAAHEVYAAAGRWVVSPLPWPITVGSGAHFVITDRPKGANAWMSSRQQGHMLAGIAGGDGLWIASFLTRAVRESRPSPDVQPPDIGQVIVSEATFPNEEWNARMVTGHRPVNLDWNDGSWHSVMIPKTSGTNMPAAPAVEIIRAPDAGTLLEAIQARPAGADPVVKIVRGKDCWVALTRPGPVVPVEWILVDSLDHPALALLLDSGRKIHLLAGFAPETP